MASILSAGTTNSTALNLTADTSGSLILASNNNVTAVTIDAKQNATFTGSVNAPNSFGFKNRIINGGMVIDQRNAGANVTIGSAGNLVYTLDRWAAYCEQNSKFSVQQNAGSVTPPTGFSNYLGVTSLSAYTVGASEAFGFNQLIEGFNTADLGFGSASASTVTLSFWVRSSLTGTFGGSLRNNASNRSYPFSYTISTANTWEQKSITIAGDTSGTWIGATNGIGLRVWFSLGVGSTYTGTANAWAGTNYLQPTGATSVVGTDGATFYITGVQLEKGSIATSFDYRPYTTELQLCQRYYYGYVSGWGKLVARGGYFSATQVEGSIYFPTTMRTTPTLVATSGTNYYIVYRGGGDDVINSLTLNNEASAASVSVNNNTEASGTIGYAAQIATNNASASVAFNAEL